MSHQFVFKLIFPECLATCTCMSIYAFAWMIDAQLAASWAVPVWLQAIITQELHFSLRLSWTLTRFDNCQLPFSHQTVTRHAPTSSRLPSLVCQFLKVRIEHEVSETHRWELATPQANFTLCRVCSTHPWRHRKQLVTSSNSAKHDDRQEERTGFGKCGHARLGRLIAFVESLFFRRFCRTVDSPASGVAPAFSNELIFSF